MSDQPQTEGPMTDEWRLHYGVGAEPWCYLCGTAYPCRVGELLKEVFDLREAVASLTAQLDRGREANLNLSTELEMTRAALEQERAEKAALQEKCPDCGRPDPLGNCCEGD